MKINTLELTNFRNYESLTLKFNPNINIFIGNNGEGKTNILESIYVLAVTKSHRSNIEKNLIKQNSEFSKIKGNISIKNKDTIFELLLNSKGKKVSINNIPIKKISNYLSNFSAILFCPDDLELIKGSPGERRKFLNIEIGQMDNNYLHYLNNYNNLIKNRNEYLKTINIDSYNKNYIEIINKQIIDVAINIYKYRYLFIKNLEDKLKKIYKEIYKEKISIKYINTCDLEEYNEQRIREILKIKLNDNIKKEILLGNTLYGPHKDDFEIYVDNNNLKEYGSQGQQRLAVLCIKISELDIFKESRDEYPILLLDDIFSELDIKNRNNIISLVNSNVQIFITATDIKYINKKIINSARIYKINNCKVS